MGAFDSPVNTEGAFDYSVLRADYEDAMLSNSCGIECIGYSCDANATAQKVIRPRLSTCPWRIANCGCCSPELIRCGDSGTSVQAR
jgi:hypothetical protein